MSNGERASATASHPWRGLWLALAAVALVALLWLSLAGSLAAARARVYPQPAITLSVSLPGARAHAHDPLTFTAMPSAGRDLTYSWDFGDGQQTTGPGRGITHAYDGMGDFFVTLTATDPIGQQTTITRQVTIFPDPPQAAFSYTADPSQPLDVTFSASFLNGAVPTFSWDFGDGSSTPQTGSPTVLHIYPRFGSYTVTLTETDSAGQSDKATQRITLTRPPTQAVFSVVPTAGNTQTFTFDGTASTGYGLRYDWDFGDGATAQGATPMIQHTYPQPGTYKVTLTITDDQGKISASSIALVVS